MNDDQIETYRVCHACGNRTPPIPDPEPVIGPGMILERGRERIAILSNRPDSDGDYKVSITVRRWFGRGWRDSAKFPYISAGVLRDNISDGYYIVIRTADSPTPGAGARP